MTKNDRPFPPQPTDAPAGSEQKIAVMLARRRAGFSLHHPGDNPAKVEQRPDPEPPPGID